MKKYIILLFCTFSVVACQEEKKDTKEGKDLLSTDIVNNPLSAEGLDSVAYEDLPTMDFDDTVHNFGNITDGQKATHDFKFVNNGKTPLIISYAKGSCGCTVAEYPKDPIAPGESGVMKVLFDSKDKSGHQEKSVSITTNSKRGLHTLYIKADIVSTN